ncbi:MAG: transposase [Pleurocapsa minor GSE-CHR-MK-17-07R]|jgi:REP element-mobilizing transposase RayT|nr:transposase [Pleurocapsa minor GSE-CHR-MK 17-07R]
MTRETARRSGRLAGWDYAGDGAYFVTICTHAREVLFGEIVDGVANMNAFGDVAKACWMSLPSHFPHVEIDAFVVMPNHVHGILMFHRAAESGSRDVGARHALPLRQAPAGFGKPQAGSLGTVIGAFKSATARHINMLRDVEGGPVWQRSYYDHIIRDERDLNHCRQYIITNPARHEERRHHTNGIT